MPTTTPFARRRMNGTLAVLVLLLAVLSALPALSQTVIFQSRLNDAYLALDNRGLLAAIARGPAAQPFEMIPLQGNRVAFRDPASGRFLRAGVGQATHLALGEPHIRAWETFELVRLADGDVNLRSVQSGGWVGFDGTGPLTARWGTAGAGQRFRMAPVSLPAAPPQAPPPPPPPTEAWVHPSNLWFAGRWSVRDIHDGAGQRFSFNDRILRELWIAFDRDGRVEGQSACNRFTAQVSERGVFIRIDNFLTFRRGCVQVRSEIERAFYDAITSLNVVVGGSSGPIELRDRNNRIRAVLVRQR